MTGGVWRVTMLLSAVLTAAGMSYAGQDSTATAEVQPVDKAWIEISPPVDHTYRPLVNYGFVSMDGAKPDAPLTLYMSAHVGTASGRPQTEARLSATWALAAMEGGWATGTNGSSRNWSLAVDPTHSNVLYTVDGYGSSRGLWKSANGGVDWDPLLSAAVMRATTNDINNIAIDPSDHLHLLVTGTVRGPVRGLIESVDCGVTWKPHPPLPGWGTGPVVEFLGRDDERHPSQSHWLLASQSGGIWRTADAGKNWVRVSDYNRSHAGFGLYRASIFRLIKSRFVV